MNSHLKLSVPTDTYFIEATSHGMIGALTFTSDAIGSLFSSCINSGYSPFFLDFQVGSHFHALYGK